MKLCLYLLFSLIAYFAFANGKPVQDEEYFENDDGLLSEMEPSPLSDKQNQDEEIYKSDVHVVSSGEQNLLGVVKNIYNFLQNNIKKSVY